MTAFGRRSFRQLWATTAALAVVLSGCGAPAPEPTTAQATSLPSALGSGLPGPGSGEVPAPAQRSPSPAGSPVATAAARGDDADAYADPSAITVVVNKRRPLNPVDYAPSELVLPDVALAVDRANAMLRPDAANAVEEMFAAAADDDVVLTLVSGYRSYAVQADTYNYWVSLNGSAEDADNYSARPGFSEHQTGLAFDIGQGDGACTLRGCFGDTAAGIWAANNAHEFGFILRYPEGRQETTGFLAESWHFRFVGIETAASMRADGTETLEDHVGLSNAPDYG
ncbi:M15 family metallopeptidase [Arthrobacter sp. H20]|uniref:M15 family metallopeptidase n=1 Tax=Arthrobacter sp. H20 TaxID=1267981 RepID=UPI00047C4337|nr:M15 family metallopeptidase [Arthrobacter sp. H20]